MAEAHSASTYEERPKVNWFLYAAAGFFGVMAFALIQAPNSWGKWLWLVIALLNLAANLMQINFARSVRYSLWRRGLSIYTRQTREALIRFDKTLVFKLYQGHSKARPDLKEFGVKGPLRSFPAFGGRRRWLVVFERDDGANQAVVFDPSPFLENRFREELNLSVEAEQERQGRAEPPVE
jgi:hypothetical protein